MKLKRFLYQSACVVGLVGAISACTKMDDNYKDFVKDGEIIYAGKPNRIVAHGGVNRLVLTLMFDAEPIISKVKVYWNFRSDSATFNVKKLPGQNIDLTFPTMAKGAYTFELYTFDAAGNRSIKTEANGQVYDAADVANLAAVTMPLRSANIIERSGVLEWYKTDYFAGVEVNYINTAGAAKKAKVLGADKIKAVFADAKPGSAYSYRTLYLPDVYSLDTAYSAYINGNLPLYSQLDKSKMKENKLPGDYAVLPVVSNGTSLEVKKMWDDRYGDDDAYASGTAALTGLSFTIDLGVTQKIGYMRLHQRGINNSPQEAALLYNAGNLQKWELWGTANTPATDGSYTGWTKLGDLTVTKPSNSARGTNTQADKDAANAGHLVTVPTAGANIPVRYVRIKPTANWAGVTNILVGELAFYEPAY